jgi:hypothetical protein
VQLCSRAVVWQCGFASAMMKGDKSMTQ